ncbi:IS30 family transposase ISSlu1 [bioreactor metagenome]|uniref:IS30 family transposase ISSlu1 n=1 Tax=bioreactor metagenome TaxID=1076179 RepID=A0A645CFL3_9ZZZZ
MNHYRHLTIDERESIWELCHEGKGPQEIGRRISRSASTISRELARNSYLLNGKTKVYRPSTAQRKYAARRERCRRRELLEDEGLQTLVERLIVEQSWSPEQVQNRLKLEGSAYRISYTTIYRWIRAGRIPWKPEAPRYRNIALHLRHQGTRKHKKGEAEHRGKRNYPHKLSERPEAANKREEIGHWEADTLQGKINSGCVALMVDRKSRFTLGDKARRKFSDDVAQVMMAQLSSVPAQYVKSITPDRGTEFAAHAIVTERVHQVPFYFPPPHSPWERPTVENTNGLLRQYIPVRADLTKLTEADVRKYIHLLNTRPRKCLGWKTPTEVFFGSLLHLT